MSEAANHSIDDYELLCVIGRGVFGKIYLVREVKSAQVFAMKVVKKHLIEQKNKLNYIFTERNLLIEVKLILGSLSIHLSSRFTQLSKTKPSFTSLWSIVRAESSITFLPSRKSFHSNSISFLIQSQIFHFANCSCS